MKNVKRLLSFVVVFMVVIVAFCTTAFAATIGQPLTSPDAGWQRIDDKDTSIDYRGVWTDYFYGGGFKGGAHYSEDVNGSASFNFTGTKLRIIGYNSTDASRDVAVNVDGVEVIHSQNASNQGYILEFEASNLSNTEHTCKIYKKTSGFYRIDAVDIDMNAVLKPFNSNIISAPTNLSAIVNSTQINLSWDTVTGATSYNIKRAATAGGTYTKLATSSAITYTDTTAKNVTTYYYVVTAVNASGESPYSNEVSATPQATNQLKLVLEVNEDKQLSVSEELSDNTEKEWTSSDSTIATVDENGKVKALKPGNTVITCTGDNYTESINILVVDLEYQLAVDLSIGDKCRLTVDDLANATNITWSLYDSTIATVTAKGKVTAISEGLTYIDASDKDGKEIGRIYVRVRQ